MRVVWKQDISEEFEQTYEWPRGARIVHADMQNGRPRVWFECDPEAVVQERKFLLYPTGTPINEDAYHHAATFMLCGGKILVHLYEKRV